MFLTSFPAEMRSHQEIPSISCHQTHHPLVSPPILFSVSSGPPPQADVLCTIGTMLSLPCICNHPLSGASPALPSLVLLKETLSTWPHLWVSSYLLRVLHGQRLKMCLAPPCPLASLPHPLQPCLVKSVSRAGSASGETAGRLATKHYEGTLGAAENALLLPSTYCLPPVLSFH